MVMKDTYTATVTGGSPEAETTAWKSAVIADGGTVSSARETLVNNLIVTLKTAGVWSKLNRLWLFAAENAKSAKFDIKGANALGTLTGTPFFSANQGYTCVYPSHIIDTDYTLDTDAGSALYHSFHEAVWNLMNVSTTETMISPATANSNYWAIFPRYTDGNAYLRINEGFSAGTAVATAIGFYAGNRSGTAAVERYKDGALLLADTSAAAMVFPNDNMYHLTKKAAVISFGSSMTATEHGDFYTALDTYMSAVKVLPTIEYLFETFSSGSTPDNTVRANNGVVTGSPSIVTGHSGNGLSFNGSTDYIEFTDPSAVGLMTANDECTVAAWIKTTAADTPIFSIRSSGGNAVFDFLLGYNGVNNAGTGKLSIIVRDDAGGGLTTLNASTAINNNSWHHVAVTRDSAKLLTLYVDGSADGTATDTMTSSLLGETGWKFVGRERQQGWFYSGVMDNFRWYNRAISAGEVTALAT
jgi:Concanavalin A-like lectin/glucanases superfamily